MEGWRLVRETVHRDFVYFVNVGVAFWVAFAFGCYEGNIVGFVDMVARFYMTYIV
jgi:hypothetical protein